MRRGLVALLTSAGLAVLASYPCAAASAGVVAKLRYAPIEGPVFAGDAVVWANANADLGLSVWVAQPGQVPRQITRFRPPDNQHLLSGHLAGSASRIVLELRANFLLSAAKEQRQPPTLQVYESTRLGGFAERSQRCTTEQLDTLRSVDVDADALAFRASGAAGTSAQGECVEPQFELSSGSVSPAPPGAFGLRVAGRYLAWLEGPFPGDSSGVDDVVVYDTAAGREAYRVSAGALSGGIVSFDLDAGGQVAVGFVESARTGREGVAVADPAEPRLRVLNLPTAGQRSVRMTPRGLAVMSGAGFSGIFQGSDVGAQLAVVDPHSGAAGVIVKGAYQFAGADNFDVSSDSAVWMSRTCSGVVIRQSPAQTLTAVPVPKCRLRLTRRPRVLDGGRRVDIFGSCVGFSRTCSLNRVSVRDRRSGALLALGAGSLTQPGFASIKLTRRGRQAVACQRALRVRVTGRTEDVDFGNTAPASRTRAATTTLVNANASRRSRCR